MRKLVFLSALAAFVILAGLTVHLQVRASIRAYALAEELERARVLHEEAEVRRLRMETELAPEVVYRWVLRYRDQKRLQERRGNTEL